VKTEVKSVAHKGANVSSVTVTIYETIDELLAAEKAEHIVNMFNKQNVIRLQANERAKFTEERQGKGKMKMDAYNLLTADELAAYAGKWAELQAFLTSPEMVERVKQANA
jgi:hypothetical protein